MVYTQNIKKGENDAKYKHQKSKMKRKKSIVSFLVLFVMALTFIFTDSQTTQAAQVTSITSGDEYVIVSNGYALTVSSSGNLSGTAYTDGETTVTDAMKWTVTQYGNGYTIYNESTGRYLKYSNSVTTTTNSNQATSWNFNSSNGFYRSVYGQRQYLGFQTYGLNSRWGIGRYNSNTLYTVDTDSTVYEYYPFSVNLFNYNTELINAANSSGIQFNTGEAEDGSINKWTGWGAGPFTGIVADTLDENGNLQFNNNYDTVGILETGTAVSGKSVYTNVQLPFKYEDGYYTFDSDDYDVYFEDGNAQSGATLVVNENQKTMTYDHDVSVWNGNTREVVSDGTGFFPFDGAGDTDPTYHFGMTFSTEFFMTENGYIDGDTSEDPISFEFSGDDDVWVFVDGRLVLDLGGIHDKVSGSINFAKGTSQVYYQNVSNGETVEEATQDLWELLGTTADEWRSSTTPHTLQVFYLERGKGASNCKISFNLPQKNCVEVAKIMGNETSDQSELDALNNQNFTFQAYSKEEGTDQWTPFANRVYYLYESNGQYVSAYRTDSNGEFSLKFGQTARFYMDQDIYTGSDAEFYVTEVNAQNSEKSWTASVNGVQQGTSDTENSPELTISQMEDSASQTSVLTTYTFNCTNTVGAQANDDLVVLDYGKPVQIDVLANDTLFGNDRSVGGIKETDESSYINEINLENGTASVENDKIVYTPTEFLDSIDHLDYVVGDEAAEDGTNTATVSVIPATNVYYEDDFAVSNGGNAVIEYSGTCTTGVADGNEAGEYQSDENRVYGQDAAYASQNGFSDGSATAMDQGATATFTFNGTGVDIYTKTDTESPIVTAWIYRQTTDESGATSWKAVQSVIVDNKYDVEGEDLYQIPTICFDVEEYGTYKVKIQVMSATTDTAKYYLDAIRIYNPVDPSSEDAEEAESAYQLAGEAGPVVTEVRDILLKAEDLTDSGRANGIVYLDNMTEGTANIADYEKDGPKNEVYLDSGNAIAFTIEGYDDTQQVYLGVKAPEGQASKITVTNGTTTRTIEITSATDMYFTITPTSSGHVVIQNSGENLVSITKIRTTNMQGDTAEAQALNFVVDENTLAYTQEFSVMALNAYDNTLTEEPDETEETVDIDVDISNPEPDNNPDIAQANSVADLIQSIISGLKSLFSNWR